MRFKVSSGSCLEQNERKFVTFFHTYATNADIHTLCLLTYLLIFSIYPFILASSFKVCYKVPSTGL